MFAGLVSLVSCLKALKGRLLLASLASLAHMCVVLAQSESDNIVFQVIPVRANIFMLSGGGGNTTVQVGDDGVFLVDGKSEAFATEIMHAVDELFPERHLRYLLVNTHAHPDHAGGNATVAGIGLERTGIRTDIIAHENVSLRMATGSARNERGTNFEHASWPTISYFTSSRDLHFNGEAIEIHHVPSAHTDGDSIVFFRGSDVLSTGDIFSKESYPVIDLEQGGSVQGVIDALNLVLRITVPAKNQEGGTMVIPGHGRLCDEADVVEYRNMLTIVRDRVQHLIAQGHTLEQVLQARPTLDYDTEYGTDSGSWTTEQFVEAVYRSLSEN